MTELDAELGQIAVDTLDEFGKSVSYLLTGAPVYDVATGTATSTDIPVEGVKIAPPEEYSMTLIATSDGAVQKGDKKFTTAAKYFENAPAQPSEEDKISYDGETFSVTDIKTVYSGELPCLYILQGRN